jgi:diguanylate cyclase (GGDEF)-like protein
VRIRATLSPLFNISRQMIGARLLCPGLASVKIMEAPPGDPFNLPIIPVDRLLRWDNVEAVLHRVHLRGRVTLQWPGSSLCIRDATRGICAQTVQDSHVALGDDVDVVGFVGVDNGTAVLTDAFFKGRSGSRTVAAETVTVEQALQGKHDSELIQIDGRLIGKDMATTDTTLLLTSGTTVFAALLPKNLTWSEANAWEIGSKLRIAGICSVQLDAQRSATGEGMAVPKSFRVLMRSPGDVAVLQRPSWWTAGHALVLLALVLTGMLLVLGWVMALRKRVEQQTILLRESEKRFRHMAHHDSLTGLATRLVFQDRLNVALKNAKRHHTELALIMMDLDNFKNINDTLGHQAGDEVLRVTAERIVGAVRKSDTVARMGGDEFIALLPDLRVPLAAESIAAKVVAALSVPIPFAGGEVPVSVSAGVCTVSSGEIDADTLLMNVDVALYNAKALGRNCFQSFAPELD